MANKINIKGNSGENNTFNATINRTGGDASNSMDLFLTAFELGKLQAHMEQQHKETEIALIHLVLENVRRNDRPSIVSAIKCLPPAITDTVKQLSLSTLSGILANKLS